MIALKVPQSSSMLRHNDLSKRIVAPHDNVASFLPLEVKTCLLQSRYIIQGRRSKAICSYNRQESLKSFFWDGKAIFLQGIDICANSFFYVSNSFLSGPSLADATRETRNLSHPIAILPRGR
jgi:hypothetical protein